MRGISSNNRLNYKPLIVEQERRNVSEIFSLIFTMYNRKKILNYIPVFFSSVPINFYSYKISEFIYVLEVQQEQNKKTKFNNKIAIINYFASKEKKKLFVNIYAYEINSMCFFIRSENDKVLLNNIKVVIGYRRLVYLFKNANILDSTQDYSEILSFIYSCVFKPFIIDLNIEFTAQTNIYVLKALEEYYHFIIASFYIFCELENFKYQPSKFLQFDCGFMEKVYNFFVSSDKNIVFKFSNYCLNLNSQYIPIVTKNKIRRLCAQFKEKIEKNPEIKLSYIGSIIKDILEKDQIHDFVKSLESSVNLNMSQIESILNIKKDHAIEKLTDQELSSNLINKFNNYVYTMRFNKNKKTEYKIQTHVQTFIEQICEKNNFRSFKNFFQNILQKLIEIATSKTEDLMHNPFINCEPNKEFYRVYNKCNAYQTNIIDRSQYYYYGLFLEMGLGKTFISLVEMCKYYDFINQYILIIPAQLESYWIQEIKKHDVEFLLNKIKFIKYSILSKYSILEIIDIYQTYEFQNVMIILDESTYAKSLTSTRAENIQFLLLILRIRKNYYTIIRLLTGTPYSNKASQMRGQMILLNPFITPTVKTFNAICNKAAILSQEKDNVTIYNVILLVSQKYENYKDDLSISKVYEIIYMLKFFFNYYFISLDKKAAGIEITVNKKILNISDPNHNKCLKNFSNNYSNMLKSDMIKSIDSNLDTKNSNIEINNEICSEWTRKNMEYIKYKYFFPLYYFSCGGITSNILENLKLQKVDIEFYKKSAASRIQKVIDTVLLKHKKFIYVSYCIDVLSTVDNIFKNANVKYEVITGETKIESRQAIINKYNNGEFDILVASAHCISHGFSIYATNTLVLNEPFFQIEIFEQLKNRIIRMDTKFKEVNIYIACTGAMHSRINDALNKNQNIIDMFSNITRDMLRL